MWGVVPGEACVAQANPGLLDAIPLGLGGGRGIGGVAGPWGWWVDVDRDGFAMGCGGGDGSNTVVCESKRELCF